MRKRRLSEYKLVELLSLAVQQCTASALVGMNKTTASYYFYRLRLLIHDSAQHLEMLDDEVEVDESYFGGVR